MRAHPKGWSERRIPEESLPRAIGRLLQICWRICSEIAGSQYRVSEAVIEFGVNRPTTLRLFRER